MAAPDRAWVRMPSGRRLDLLNPTPLDWEDEDLSLGLARTYRWGGHSTWDLPMSVAQHSMLVLAIHRALAPDRRSASSDFRELIHDAEEGLVGFDCILPLKPFLGENFRLLSEKLQDAVFLRYGIQRWNESEYRLHKKADRIAAASEAVYIAGWSVAEVRNTLGIAEEALETDPLAKIYGDEPWKPWPPGVAHARYLAELRRLGGLIAAEPH